MSSPRYIGIDGKFIITVMALLWVAFFLGILFGNSLCHAFDQTPKEIQITGLKVISGKYVGESVRKDCYLVVTQVQEKYAVVIYALGKVTPEGVHLLLWRQVSCIVNLDEKGEYSLEFQDPMDNSTSRVMKLVDPDTLEVTVHQGFKKGFTARLKRTDAKILEGQYDHEVFGGTESDKNFHKDPNPNGV